jgi:hypothetical protein
MQNPTVRILLSFRGNVRRRYPRKALAKLHNGHTVVIEHGNFSTLDLNPYRCHPSLVQHREEITYSPIALPEVLSCGAIPVIYADGWVVPFRLDWKEEAAVVIPEINTSQSVEILSQISKEKRCRMRRRGLELYEAYLKDAKGTVQGIIDRLEHQATVGSLTKNSSTPDS